MTKLNIHLELDHDTNRWVRRNNASLRRISRSIVNFGLLSRMKPHVTLVMGRLRDTCSLGDVEREVSSALAPFGGLKLPPSAPTAFYLEDVRGRYVFLDFAPSEPFLALKSSLDAALREKFLVPESEYSETPHITVAHVEDRHEAVRTHIATAKLPQVCGFGRVALGLAGPKGTVVSTLRTWQI